MTLLASVTNSVWQRCRKRACVFSLLLQAWSPSLVHSETLEIISKIPHSGYSEGLDFYQGYLWNALPKEILKINPTDGTVMERIQPATEYSESIKWYQGELWNLSFSTDGLYRGKFQNKKVKFEKMASLPEPHGWGMEKIGQEIVVTGNFSNKLYFFDVKSKKWGRTLVTEGQDLEDLAWDGHRLWASSFTSHRGTIFSLDIQTGKITGKWELPEKDQCPVIDGLAFDGKNLWITGKECPGLYQVKLPEQRRLSSPSKTIK